MHIQEGTNTTLTTCTKMTEEVDRRHGVNGNGSSKGATEDAPSPNSSLNATGGRLKFFKDGKFILELVRGGARAGGGGGGGWTAVPRRTYWPPAAAPPPAPRAASLSASDDTSSIHSSPWQRDHCWKQPAPRRNLSKELAMYYVRPAAPAPAAAASAAARLKRRRPFDTALLLPNGTAHHNGDAPSAKSHDQVDGNKPSDDDRRTDREKYYHMKLKKPYQYHKLRVHKKTKSPFRRKELNKTIERLREKIASLPVPVNAKLANCRQEHMMVSPRKRILRELERVSLEDQNNKRRAKTVPTLSTASYPPSPGPSHGSSHAKSESRPVNGARAQPPATKHVGNYSIHSLLSMPDENPGRHSPLYPVAVKSESYPVAVKSESYPAYAAPQKAESPHLYHLPPAPESYGPGPASAHKPGSPQQFAAGSALKAASSPGYVERGGPLSPLRREEWPYYGYWGPLLRAPPPLWMHYAVSGPPPSWPHHPLLAQHMPKDEPASDLPLNLSKH